MPNDGTIPKVSVINPKSDNDDLVESTAVTDEYSPLGEGGDEPMDIDQALKETGQAPNLEDDEEDTELVDEPLKHAVDNAGD